LVLVAWSIAVIAASTEVLSFPILSALVVLPLLGSIVVALLGKSRPEWVKLGALVSSVTTGALSLWLLAAFKAGEAGFQFVSQQLWISQWGISWHLGVDGISLFLVVLTGILFPLVIVGIDLVVASRGNGFFPCSRLVLVFRDVRNCFGTDVFLDRRLGL
jgi:NADH-quinone oxidoreductase subunit M